MDGCEDSGGWRDFMIKARCLAEMFILDGRVILRSAGIGGGALKAKPSMLSNNVVAVMVFFKKLWLRKDGGMDVMRG